MDLDPIRPIAGVDTFQGDITTDKCRAELRSRLKTWKADAVLHDGAPNVGTAWVQDAFGQAELVLQSLKLATEFLVEGGTFVTKVFRSRDYNALLWVFNQLFTKVEATKPPSSRNVSAEIFVVCRGFKAPKRIDPKFLDPRSVFAELADPTPNNEAKVFNPEKKKRKRDGYEEGNWTQHKEAPVTEFIQTTDPIAMLGGLNRLSFEQKPNGDIALATLEKLPETTQEIRTCCADLKVLGKKEFRNLLRWRLKVRERFGFASKTKAQEPAEGEEVAEIEPMDEELQMQEDMQRLKEKSDTRKKKERRRENERKQKEIVRMQLNMTTPMEIGMEQAGPSGEDAVFALKTVEKAGGLGKIAKGRMVTVVEEEKPQESGEEDDESDPEEDALERELDSMYDQYQERKADSDAKFRAKKARTEHADGEWEGFSDKEDGSDDDVVEEEASDASSDDADGEDEQRRSLITDLESEASAPGGLTRRAAMFFDQDIFKGIDGLDEVADEKDSGIELEDEDSDDVVIEPNLTLQSGRHGEVDIVRQEMQDSHDDNDELSTQQQQSKAKTSKTKKIPAQNTITEDSDDEDRGFEVVKRDESIWDTESEPMKNGRPDIDIITAEAMTLAHDLATGRRTRADLVDDGFSKYSLRDTDGLPEWFLDDEGRHSKPHRPISAAAAAAIKEKQRALNARPIKKVREAKDRKKFRAAQRLEKLKRKSALLAEEEGLSERDKAANITKLMAKAAKKKPKRKVSVVVARGGNRGVGGRPRGVKGKYKMVDARLKKDVRAMKRVEKRKK